MLLALSFLQLTILTLANPFHKYPYVFLLDVGNEELEKVNTEQIRVSKQGGSLALRHPAIGFGEDIAHVRVSGIDFGTDLKANIVDGGPGYKYVVLVLMGNPGVNYDAVITIQTVPNENDESSLQNIDNNLSNSGDQKEDNDVNDSAEDLSDSAESEKASQISIKENAELTQESSNVYSYAVNEALSGYGSNVHSNDEDVDDDGSEIDENYDSEDDENSDQKDIHVPYKQNQIQIEESDSDESVNNDVYPSLIGNKSQEPHDNDDYSTAIDDQNYAYDDGNQEQVKTDLYEENEAFRQNEYKEGEVYPQSPERFGPDPSGTVYVEEPGESDGPLDLEEIFGHDYDDTDDRQYSDKNNNYFIDQNDGSAVAY